MPRYPIAGCGQRRSLLPVLASGAIALLLVACGTGPTDQGDLTGMHVALAVPHQAEAEVSGVFFKVTNDLGEAREAIFSLEEQPLPDSLSPDLAGYPFTDWLVLLRPGDYTIAATPLKKDGSPSDLYPEVRGRASVFPGMTTELMLTGKHLSDTN